MHKSVRLEDNLSECLHEDILGFPGGSDGKESAYSVGYLVSIPDSGRSPGEDNGSPLQYAYLGESGGQRSLVDYSAWVAKSQTRLSDLTATTFWQK